MATRGTKRIEATILCTDPLVDEETGLGQVKVKLDREPGLGDGPTSSSVAVVDYNADLDQVLVPARLRKDKSCFAIGQQGRPRENLGFHQVNVWAVIQRTLGLLEEPALFGRPIPWQSGRGRLLVLPHAGYGANAFYDRGSGALHFLYFEGKGGRPVYTCLSHDIVTHELGHAVLDGLKPCYNELSSPETAGFHEFFGDALAIASSLTFSQVLARAVGRGPRVLGSELVGRIGREFGAAMPGGAGQLRAAFEKKTMSQLKGEFEEHEHSKLPTNVFFSLLAWLYQRRLRERVGPGTGKVKGNDAVAALVSAARQTARTFFRGLDYCPPCDLTYLDYARAVLAADRVASPDDPSGVRAQVQRLFLERGVGRGERDFEPERRLHNRDLVEFDVERLSATPEEAYRFLDANREPRRLDIPYGANLQVAKLYRTRKISEGGYYAPRETVLEFLWPEDVTLEGLPHPALAGKRFTLWCGGTLVFDHNGNVLSYALRKGTPERRERLVAYLAYLARRGRVGMAGLDTDLAGRDRHQVVARLEGQRVHLAWNPALRHEGRVSGAGARPRKG